MTSPASNFACCVCCAKCCVFQVWYDDWPTNEQMMPANSFGTSTGHDGSKGVPFVDLGKAIKLGGTALVGYMLSHRVCLVA